ncbi:hypothetical protein EV363DRAFT_1302160 [Boletus edulis]|nr:hypothetical protein EV363DRAFT_1302160 [Boletus edulis]
MSGIANIKDWPEGRLAECEDDDDDTLTAKFAERRRRAKVRKEEEACRKAEEEHREAEVHRKAEEEQQRKACAAELRMKREREQQAEKAKGKGKQRSGDPSDPIVFSSEEEDKEDEASERGQRKTTKSEKCQRCQQRGLACTEPAPGTKGTACRPCAKAHITCKRARDEEESPRRGEKCKVNRAYVEVPAGPSRSNGGPEKAMTELVGKLVGVLEELVEEVRGIREEMTRMKEKQKERKDVEVQTEGTEVSDDSEGSEDEASEGLGELTMEEMEAGVENDGEGNELKESGDDREVFRKWDRSSEVQEKVDALDHWGRRIGVSKDMTELERRSSEVTKTRPGVQELHESLSPSYEENPQKKRSRKRIGGNSERTREHQMSFLSKGEFNSEPEGKEEQAEMCQWHELHRSATERGAMEHPEFKADATKENGGGCNEPEDVPILPAERDRESLEGCLHVTEWWSNSRSCHRMSEDAAETGLEEVRRWAVKRTGERSENRKNAEQSSHNPGKGKRVEVTRSSGGSYRKNAQHSDAKAEKRESTELMSGAPEMDLNSLE